MFSSVTSFAPRNNRSHAATAIGNPPRQRFASPSTVEEAYEMRLLAEVARWDDQAAFDELYARHHAAVARIVLQVCRDRWTAEEIVQQTFTALWVRAERLVQKSVRLRPWLTTVARNAAIDHLRADRETLPIEHAHALAADESSPVNAAIASQTSAELRKAIASLSAEQRAAIELVYLDGMTYAAAAQTLGEPVGTIKSRVRLAIGHLREQFAGLAGAQ